MTKVNAPAASTPNMAFMPLQQPLTDKQYTYDENRKYSHQRNWITAAPSLVIQPKLAIGESDDEYEREADRVADTVMRMPEPKIQRT
jgi:dihydroorotase-like cyclic amidohydrolase